MLRVLFPRAAGKYERSRYSVELRSFGHWLLSQGYSECNARNHVRLLFKVLAHNRNIASHRLISDRLLHRAFERRCASAHLSWQLPATESAYARFLKSEERLLYVTKKDTPLKLLRRAYHDYLINVRGLSQSTACFHDSTVSEFLQDSLRGTRGIATLTRAHVERYLEKKSSRVTRQSMKNAVARLRAFLRYAYAKELVPERLDVIDTPRTYRDELLPRALPWPFVKKLLRSVDRSSKAGWRDFMMLHLMAYYGLRPSEIAALRVGSIDWHAKTCRVEQRKTRTDLILPLLDATITMLRRYLRRGRSQCASPQLFLRVRRPTGALGRCGVGDVFSKRAAQSGLPLDGYSPYSLRHSFAMRLLHRGVGVKAIGDLLGHRSLEATCLYLRLDISALRAVALPLPRVKLSAADHHA